MCLLCIIVYLQSIIFLDCYYLGCLGISWFCHRLSSSWTGTQHKPWWAGSPGSLQKCRITCVSPCPPTVLTPGMTATLLPPRYWKVCFYLKPGGFVLVPHLCIFLTGLFCTFGTHFVILLNCFRGKFSSRSLTCGSTFSLSFSAEAIDLLIFQEVLMRMVVFSCWPCPLPVVGSSWG